MGKSSSATFADASDWIGPQPGDPKPILYFSGLRRWCDKGEEDIRALTGWKYRCFSYWYVRLGCTAEQKESWEKARDSQVRILMDSGAHSFLSKKAGLGPEELDSYLDEYAAFLQANKGRFDFSVTFDYVKHAPEVYRVHQSLLAKGVKTLPVFHGDSSLDWIRRYHDQGHVLIGLGKPKSHLEGGKYLREHYYGRVFNLTEKLGMKCHGFAVSGSNAFHYPWHSLDSASWLLAAVKGLIMIYDMHLKKMRLIHVSKETHVTHTKKKHSLYSFPARVWEPLEMQMKLAGVSLDQISSSSFYRAIFNVRAQLLAFYGQSIAQAATKGLHTWEPLF